jgi:hypothetical protein
LREIPQSGSAGDAVNARPVSGAPLLLFAITYSTARLTGNRRNEIGDAEYVEGIAEIDSPAYVRPGGETLRRRGRGVTSL